MATHFSTPSPFHSLPLLLQGKPHFLFVMFFQSAEAFTLLLFTLCCHHGAISSLQPLLCASYVDPFRLSQQTEFP